MTPRVVAIAIGVTFLSAAIASAQTPAATTKPGAKRAREFAVGGAIAGPSSLGSADATLLGGAGTPSVTLFSVENRQAMGAGLELSIGVEIRRALWVEVGGSWTRANLRSRITDDFEGAEVETASSPMSRFVLDGSLVRYFRERGNTAWYFRGTGGWMRETSGGNTLTPDGFIAGGGIGLRHWWRTNGKGAAKRFGIRAEGRATVRSGGLSLGESSLRFGPSGAVHIVWGF